MATSRPPGVPAYDDPALDGIKDLDTGGISEPITYGDTDHAGLSGTRPYKFNYDTKKFEAVGDFADYDGAITNEYSSH